MTLLLLPSPAQRRLQHLQFNRFVRVSALQHLPLSLASLTLNLPEGSSVAECKELPRGLCLQSLEVVAAGVAINWADLCRTQRCTVSGSAMLSILVGVGLCVRARAGGQVGGMCMQDCKPCGCCVEGMKAGSIFNASTHPSFSVALSATGPGATQRPRRPLCG